MAYEIPGFSWPQPANADFSSGTVKNRAVSINSSGKIILPAANYLKIIGVAQNKPKLGEGVTIVSGGVVVMDAAGVNDAASPANAAINPGDVVTARSSDGKAVKAITAGSQTIGVVVGDAGVGSGSTGQISVKLFDGLSFQSTI
jgi:hypothetical protein